MVLVATVDFINVVVDVNFDATQEDSVMIRSRRIRFGLVDCIAQELCLLSSYLTESESAMHRHLTPTLVTKLNQFGPYYC